MSRGDAKSSDAIGFLTVHEAGTQGVLGGYLVGLLVVQFAELGAISLWGLGVLAGIVSRKITVEPSRVMGWSLVAAVLFAAVFAEVCWIHWKTVGGAESWMAAIKLLPNFVQTYKTAALFAAIAAAFGAYSAFWRAGKRYRTVILVEE